MNYRDIRSAINGTFERHDARAAKREAERRNRSLLDKAFACVCTEVYASLVVAGCDFAVEERGKRR